MSVVLYSPAPLGLQASPEPAMAPLSPASPFSRKLFPDLLPSSHCISMLRPYCPFSTPLSSRPQPVCFPELYRSGYRCDSTRWVGLLFSSLPHYSELLRSQHP